MSAPRPRSLIVLPARGLSDTVLLLPALELLIETLPYAEVSIGYLPPEQQEVLRLSTLSVPTFPLDGWPWWRDGGWWRQPVSALRRFRHNLDLLRSFDQVVFLEVERLVPRMWVRTALWARARVLLHGIEEGYFTSNRCFYYQQAVARLLNRPTAGSTRLPKLVPGAAHRQAVDAFLQRSAPTRKPLIYLNPSVPKSRQILRWSNDGFITTAHRLVRLGAHLLIHGDAEAEPELTAGLVEPLAGHAEWLPPLSLGETAALLARCALYIGHDTGLTHVALAVGTPALTLYGPTPDELYAGYSPLQTIIKNLTTCPIAEGKAAQACPGCERFETSTPRAAKPRPLPYPCLESLRAADVIAAAERMLNWKDPRDPVPKPQRSGP